MTEIKPRIDENGEPMCSGRRCPSYPPLTVEGLKEQCWGPQNECVPAIRQQRDEAQAKLAKWNNRVLKLEHELKEKTELAARLMEEAEKWKGAAGALSLATYHEEGQAAAHYLDRYLEHHGWDIELTRDACMEEVEDIEFTLDNYPRVSQ